MYFANPLICLCMEAENLENLEIGGGKAGMVEFAVNAIEDRRRATGWANMMHPNVGIIRTRVMFFRDESDEETETDFFQRYRLYLDTYCRGDKVSEFESAFNFRAIEQQQLEVNCDIYHRKVMHCFTRKGVGSLWVSFYEDAVKAITAARKSVGANLVTESNVLINGARAFVPIVQVDFMELMRKRGYSPVDSDAEKLLHDIYWLRDFALYSDKEGFIKAIPTGKKRRTVDTEPGLVMRKNLS